LSQRCRRLLVWEWDNRIPNITAGNIDIAELTRVNRFIVISDTNTTGFETTR
jgi:hypothetical protein